MTQNVRVGTGYISINIDRTGLQRSLREAQRDVDSWVSGVNRSIQNGLSNSFRNGMQNAQRSMQSSLQQTQQSINSSLSGSQQSITSSLQGGFKSGFSGVAGLAGGARSAITGLMGGMASLITGGLKTAFVGGFAGVAGLAVSAVSSIKGAITGVGSFITSTLSSAFNAGFQVAKVGAVAAGTAIVGAIADGTNKAATFEQKMKDVQATMNATNEEAASLKDLAMDLALSDKLNVSADQAAQAIEILALNGVKAQDMIDGMAEKTVALANATGNDFKTSADLMTDVMAQFKLGVEDAGMVIDGLTGITTNSKIDIQNAMYAFANGGQAAADAGMSFEDFSTTLAGIASSFSSGQTAATSFSTLIGRMSHPVGDAKKAMEELDLSMFDAAGNMKPMEQIITELRASLDGLTQQEVARLSKMLGGDDAKKAVGALAGLTAEKFLELKDAVNATGQAQQSAATRTDTFLGAWNILNSAIESTRIAIGDEFLPIFTEMIRDFTGFYKSHAPQVIAFFGKIADGVEVTYRQLKYLFTPITDGSGEALSVFDNLAIKLQSFSPMLASIVQAIGKLVEGLLGARNSVMDAWGSGGVFGMFESFTGFDVTGALGLDNIPAIAKDVAKQAGNALDTVGSKVKQSVSDMTGGVIGGPAVEAGPSQPGGQGGASNDVVSAGSMDSMSAALRKYVETVQETGEENNEFLSALPKRYQEAAKEIAYSVTKHGMDVTRIYGSFNKEIGFLQEEAVHASGVTQDEVEKARQAFSKLKDSGDLSWFEDGSVGSFGKQLTGELRAAQEELNNFLDSGFENNTKIDILEMFEDRSDNEMASWYGFESLRHEIVSTQKAAENFGQVAEQNLTFDAQGFVIGTEEAEKRVKEYIDAVATYNSSPEMWGDPGIMSTAIGRVPEQYRDMATQLADQMEAVDISGRISEEMQASYAEAKKGVYHSGDELRAAYEGFGPELKRIYSDLAKETTAGLKDNLPDGKTFVPLEEAKDSFGYYLEHLEDTSFNSKWVLDSFSDKHKEIALQVGESVKAGTVASEGAWDEFAKRTGVASEKVGQAIEGGLQFNTSEVDVGLKYIEKSMGVYLARVIQTGDLAHETLQSIPKSHQEMAKEIAGSYKEMGTLSHLNAGERDAYYERFGQAKEGILAVLDETNSEAKISLDQLKTTFYRYADAAKDDYGNDWVGHLPKQYKDVAFQVGKSIEDGTLSANEAWEQFALKSGIATKQVQGNITDLQRSAGGLGGGGIMGNLQAAVKGTMNRDIKGPGKAAVEKAKETSKAFVQNIAAGINEDKSMVAGSFGGLVDSAKGIFKELFSLPFDLYKAFQTSGVSGVIEELFSSGRSVLGDVIKLFAQLIGLIGGGTEGNWLFDLFNNIGNFVKGTGDASAIFDSMAEGARWLYETVKGYIIDITETFLGAGAADRVQELFSTVEFFVAQLVTRFQELTTATSEGGIEGFVGNLFGEGAVEQFNAIKAAIGGLITDIQIIVDLILLRMTELDEAFQEGGLVGMLSHAFGAGADASGMLATSVLELLPVLIGAFGQLFNGLKDAVYGEGGAIDSLVMAFRSFPERLVAWVLSPEAEEAFANIGKAIADFIVGSFSHDIENGEEYGNVLMRFSQLLLEGVAAIAFTFVAIGAQIVANIALGILEGITGEEGAGAITMSEFTKIMTGVAEMIKTYGWMEVGAEVLNQIIAGITNLGEEAFGALTNLGVQMGQGVMDGITSMTDTSAISDWVYGMVGEAESAAQIQSPSKLFENRFGRPIGQGAIRGFEAEAVGGVSSVVGGMVNAMPNLSSLVPQPQPIPAGTFGGGDNYSFSNTINAAAGMNEEGVARKVEQKVIKSMKTLQKFRRRNG